METTHKLSFYAGLAFAFLCCGACQSRHKPASPLPTTNGPENQRPVVLRALSLTGVPDDTVLSIFAPSGVVTWRWRFAQRDRDEFETIDWYRGPGVYGYRLQPPPPGGLLAGTFYVSANDDNIRFLAIPCHTKLPSSEDLRTGCQSSHDVQLSWIRTMSAHAAVSFLRWWTPAMLHSPSYAIVNNTNARLFPRAFRGTFLGWLERWNGRFFENYDHGGKCGSYVGSPPLESHGVAWSSEPYTFGGIPPFRPGRYRYVTTYSLTPAADAVRHQLEDHFLIQ